MRICPVNTDTRNKVLPPPPRNLNNMDSLFGYQGVKGQHFSIVIMDTTSHSNRSGALLGSKRTLTEHVDESSQHSHLQGENYATLGTNNE